MKRYVFALIVFVLLLLLMVSCGEPAEDPIETKEQSNTESTTSSEPLDSEEKTTESNTDSEETDGSNAVWTPFF